MLVIQEFCHSTQQSLLCYPYLFSFHFPPFPIFLFFPPLVFFLTTSFPSIFILPFLSAPFFFLFIFLQRQVNMYRLYSAVKYSTINCLDTFLPARKFLVLKQYIFYITIYILKFHVFENNLDDVIWLTAGNVANTIKRQYGILFTEFFITPYLYFFILSLSMPSCNNTLPLKTVKI